MNTTLFVGNLPYTTTAESLQELMETFGPVEDVRVVLDKMTGRSKGFAFVQFSDGTGFQAALAADNITLEGRKLNVGAPNNSGRVGP
eukprot:CAMPEP_0174262404 /NCGR_PEP_ID=MMETSP0439-20130205/12953_1 /TAXON_ID=0 /ORGANISM="Stereomyxa ramosa, Strain Chinc5" /LENGTH=86 /DNA_ID=CAMNT_0015347103 /DNA_START=13 /DNA_END=273 /DNA_ORIENTATION=+